MLQTTYFERMHRGHVLYHLLCDKGFKEGPFCTCNQIPLCAVVTQIFLFCFYHYHSATSMSHADVFPSTDSMTKLSHFNELTLIYKSAELQLLALREGASILHDPQNAGTLVSTKTLHVLHVLNQLIHFQLFQQFSLCSFLSLSHLSATSPSSCRKLCWLLNVYHLVAKATNPKGSQSLCSFAFQAFIWYSSLKAV